MSKLRVASIAAGVALLVAGGATAALAADNPYTRSATGVVFYPNPVTTLGNQNLDDAKDADLAVFGPAYKQVVLTRLDGSGGLTGQFVVVKSSTGKAAQATNGAFPAFHRDSDEFEQIMGYYWVNTARTSSGYPAMYSSTVCSGTSSA